MSMQNAQLFQGPGKKVILLAILRQISLLSWRGGVLLSFEAWSSRPRYPLRKARRGLWKAIPRRGLRRNLPFLPGPGRAFIEYSIK